MSGRALKKLDQLAHIIMGQSPLSSTYNEDEVGLPFFQGKADFGKTSPQARMWCDSPLKIAEPNDILFCVRAPVGDINLNIQKSCIGRGLAAIRAKESQSFLYQLLLYNIENFKKLAQGSTFEAVNRKQLDEINFNVPISVDEQDTIGDFLFLVDKAIEQTEAMIEKQKRIKIGLMQDLLTKGIDEDGNIRSEKTHKFQTSTLKNIEIPKCWKLGVLKNICKVRQGLQIAIEKRFRDFKNNRFPYITIQYLNDPERYLEYIENPPEQLLCNFNDILFTRTGNTGQVVTNVTGVFHNNFFKVEITNKKILSEYLIYFLRWKPVQDLILDLAGTTTIPDLKHRDFYSIPFFFPDNENEQKIIIDVLNKQDAFIDMLNMNLYKLQLSKTGLMQDLLSGRKSVGPIMNNSRTDN